MAASLAAWRHRQQSIYAKLASVASHGASKQHGMAHALRAQTASINIWRMALAQNGINRHQNKQQSGIVGVNQISAAYQTCVVCLSASYGAHGSMAAAAGGTHDRGHKAAAALSRQAYNNISAAHAQQSAALYAYRGKRRIIASRRDVTVCWRRNNVACNRGSMA